MLAVMWNRPIVGQRTFSENFSLGKEATYRRTHVFRIYQVILGAYLIYII